MSALQTLTGRDPASDAARVNERLESFRDKEPVHGLRPIEKESLQPAWPTECAVPEVAAQDFSADLLRSAMASKGGLIVRGFLDANIAEAYIPVIDQILDTAYTSEADAPAGLLNPPAAIQSLLTEQVWKRSRGFHRMSGSVMCVESSGVCEQLLDLYRSKGLHEVLADYLGEAPCLSALKWVLRRSKLPVSPVGWHQDGAFMGEDINSINMWAPLSRCGADTGAPGLDVLAKRLTHIIGSDDAAFSWSVGEGSIAEEYGEEAIVSPSFEVGDVFFFDHYLLHRTQYKPDFPRLRYAIETWFFGDRNFPKNQVPLAW